MNLTYAQSCIAVDKHRFRVVVAGRRFGKALDIETPILTPSGFKKMKDVEIGDFVYSEKGKPIKVVFKSEIFKSEKCYEVVFSDGASLIADSKHEWVVEDKKFRKNTARTVHSSSRNIKLTTEEMISLLWVTRNDGSKETNFSIPVTEPIVFNRKEVPLPPYFMGQWLGDGHSASATITTADEETVVYIYQFASENNLKIRITSNGSLAKSYHISGKIKNNSVQTILRKLKVLNNKHIPESYKFLPYEKRLELVRGLMDSDGYIQNGFCEFTSVNKKLATDFCEVIWSLGIKATIGEYDAKLYGKVVSKKYRVCFSTHINVFSLTRKKICQKTKRKSDIYRRFIVDIRQVKSREVQCLTVDSPTKLFLAGKELIATHNSTLSAWEMYAKAVATDDGRITYIAPTFAQARDIVWMELKKICGQLQVNINESRLEIQVKNVRGNTSLITLHGWESVETMRGQKYDMLVLDEIANMKNFWLSWQEVLRPALTDRKGEGLFIGTPKGFDHLYDLYNMENDLIKGNDYKSFHFTTYDNPHLDPSEIEKAKQELTEDRFAQEYMADFRKMEGLVYKEFDRKLHLTDELPTLTVETLGGVDFGYRNPTAILTVKKDYEGVYWLVEEWYKTEQTEDMVIDVISKKKFNKVYPDPENASAISALEKKGVNIREVSKGRGSIVSGIKKVREMFKQNRIRIHKSCIHFVQEIESYAYPDWSPEKNLDELPIGKNNHAMDAFRYIIMTDAVDTYSDTPKVHYGTQRNPQARSINFKKFG